MHPELLKLWGRCKHFVHVTCEGRGASHGLQHMNKVAEMSLLIFFMNNACLEEANRQLYRIILVAMLHDVADHKYCKDGRLEEAVSRYALEECCQLKALAADATLTPPFTAVPTTIVPEEEAELIMKCIGAISYSKENKRGMGWYLGPDGISTEAWAEVRHTVSDADKLEAIGESGMYRCYAYAVESMKAERKDVIPSAEEVDTLEKELVVHVEEHFHDKLNRLATEFMRTEAGRALSEIRQTEMVEVLEKWKRSDPPSLLQQWNQA